MEEILSIIIILISSGMCSEYTHKSTDSIFTYGNIRDYCDMECNGKPHTLCENNVKPKKCSKNFHIYQLHDHDLQHDIMMGLNGLRNRIAEKMQVSNMILLSWDRELSRMAELHLARCHPFANNPCANLGSPEPGTLESEPRYYHIADTIGFRKNKFFPHHFVPSILRDWYYEKNTLNPPKIYATEFDGFYGVLKGHNNFTRLASPQLSRVGCAIARYEDGYALLCYFFPYFHSVVRFDRGAPATTCRNLFPLKGTYFTNLCTNKGAKLMLSNVIKFIVGLYFIKNICDYLRVQDVPAPRARGSDLLAKVELVMPEPQ